MATRAENERGEVAHGIEAEGNCAGERWEETGEDGSVDVGKTRRSAHAAASDEEAEEEDRKGDIENQKRIRSKGRGDSSRGRGGRGRSCGWKRSVDPWGPEE